MIRPHMKEKSTQTTMTADDPRHHKESAQLWAENADFDLEPAETARTEIYAQVLNHMRLVPEACQEPIITLNGLSETGIRRFFRKWPRKVEGGATVWKSEHPVELAKLLRLETVDRRSLGPCRLHVRGAEPHGHRLLMAQPPFTAWFKRSRASHRTQLLISFKLVVMTDMTDITPPPNCAYSDQDLQETMNFAMEHLSAMSTSKKKIPLSPAFLRMLGKEADALRAEKHASSRAARLVQRRAMQAQRLEEEEEEWSSGGGSSV